MPRPSAHSTCPVHPDTSACTEQCSAYAESDEVVIEDSTAKDEDTGEWSVFHDVEGPNEERVTIRYGYDPNCQPYGWASIEKHIDGRDVPVFNEKAFKSVYEAALARAGMNDRVRVLREVLTRVWNSIFHGPPKRLPDWVTDVHRAAIENKLTEMR
jgi:hypothetical protein